jgi:hypothetical protein
MKFIKYKQVARITLYGFDDLYNVNDSSVYTEPLNTVYFKTNVDVNGNQVGNNAKRMRFQIKGLDNVKLSEHARFCIESINVPFLYDVDNDVKSLGQTIVRMSNLSSINCFDTHGNGQTDPVIFTSQTHTSQQRIFKSPGPDTTVYQVYEVSPVFYNPYPEILYNFPISSNFLNNRYIDFTFIMQFTGGDFIDLSVDQEYFDLFHISFIVYDLDEEELLLTSTQDVDFKKMGETLPRKINNIR